MTGPDPISEDSRLTDALLALSIFNAEDEAVSPLTLPKQTFTSPLEGVTFKKSLTKTLR